MPKPTEIAKPWTPEQNKLFRAAEHDPDIARRHGLSHDEARKLAHEGVKKNEDKEKYDAKHPGEAGREKAEGRVGGDTAVENREPAMRRAKHASVGFVDLSLVFNRGGSR